MIKGHGTTIAATLLVATILVMAGCGSSTTSFGGTGSITTTSGAETSNANGTDLSLSEVALEISTISCTGCWPRVEASAKSVPGVRDVNFDKQRIQRVIVVYDPAQTSPDAIVAAIERRGDKVTEVTEVAGP